MPSDVPQPSSASTNSPTPTTVTTSGLSTSLQPKPKTPFENLPLHALLGTPMHEMSPEEQRAFVGHLLALHPPPQSYLKRFSGGNEKTKKSATTRTPATKSVDLLAGEYGV